MHEELQSLAAIAEPGELGNITRVAEEARAVWNWTSLEQLYRDVQYAFRTMRHNIGFTTTVVLSLALGIGANTAIFSLIDALMLRWLPVPDPQELVQLLVARANVGDVDGMVELYEPNAVLAVGGDKIARGTAQIRAFYANFLATGVRFNVGEHARRC